MAAKKINLPTTSRQVAAILSYFNLIIMTGIILKSLFLLCLYPPFLDGWLTVHHSISLINFQLDAQNSYLFIYNTFIKIPYMFRALPCSSSGGLRRNCIYAASGIVTLCW